MNRCDFFFQGQGSTSAKRQFWPLERLYDWSPEEEIGTMFHIWLDGELVTLISGAHLETELIAPERLRHWAAGCVCVCVNHFIYLPPNAFFLLHLHPYVLQLSRCTSFLITDYLSYLFLVKYVAE